MERSTWLKEKRRTAEARYDTLHASTYDEHWGHINPFWKGTVFCSL